MQPHFNLPCCRRLFIDLLAIYIQPRSSSEHRASSSKNGIPWHKLDCSNSWWHVIERCQRICCLDSYNPSTMSCRCLGQNRTCDIAWNLDLYALLSKFVIKPYSHIRWRKKEKSQVGRLQSLEVSNFSLESCQVPQAESGVERLAVYREHSSVNDEKKKVKKVVETSHTWESNLVDIIPSSTREVPIVPKPMTFDLHLKTTLLYRIAGKFC